MKPHETLEVESDRLMSTMTLIAIAALIITGQAPTLPPRCSPELYRLHHEIAVAVSKGEFDQAANLLRRWPSGEMTYTLPPSDALRAAAEEAARLLEDVTGGEWRFRPSGEGNVRFRWSDSLKLDDMRRWDGGVLLVDVPAYVEPGKLQVSHWSYVSLIAKSFAMYAGLAPASSRFSLMGPDIIAAASPGNVRVGVQPAERALIGRVLTARSAWKQVIESKTVLPLQEPRLVVTPMQVDLGFLQRGPDYPAPITLQNTGNAEVLIEFESSCQCILAETPGSIDPGVKRTIDAVVQSRDMLGHVQKTITLYTNDPVEPVKAISVAITAIPPYRVVPDTMRQLTLNDEGETLYEFIFYPTSPSPIRLVRVDTNVEGVETTVLPFNGDVVDPIFGDKPMRRVGHKVVLKFSTNYPAGLNWLRVVFITDLLQAPYVDVTLETHKGIIAQPKALWFGTFPVGTEQVRSVTLQHGREPFNITRVEAPDGIRVEARKQDEAGKEWRVDAVGTTSAIGRFSGTIVIHTDSKRFPTIMIPYSGIGQ